MTMSDAVKRLEGYRFGQDDELLSFLYESAIGSYSDAAVRRELNEGLVKVLESDAAYDAKQYACRMLALTATAKEVPALVRHLGDEHMGHMALYALAHLDSPEVDKALIDAMGKAEGRTQLGIIDMLGKRRVSAATDALGRLVKSADEQTSAAAIKALGHVGGKAAYERLRETGVLENAQGATGAAAGEALLSLGERMAADGQKEAARQAYDSAFAGGYSSTIRAAALRGLAEVGGDGDEVLAHIKRALKSEDQDLCTMAAMIARQTPDTNMADAISRDYSTMKPHVQVLLIKALAERHDGAGVKMISELCGSGETMVRAAAMEAMGKVGDERCVPLLVGSAVAKEADVRNAAQASLVSLKGAKVNSTLTSWLTKVDDISKGAICKVLAERGAAESAGAIVDNVRLFKDASARAEAFRAIGALGTDSDITELAKLLFAAEPSQADEIARALSMIAQRHSAQRKCAEAIVSRYGDVGSDAQKAAMLMILGGLGDEAGLATLRAGLADESAEVRYAAIKGMSAWPNGAVAEDLIKAAQSSDNRSQRVLALRGYIDVIAAAGTSADDKVAMCRRAMELADGAPEKKRVLSVLGGLDTLSAYQMVISAMEDKALADEAALAACMIAERIYARQGKQITDSLAKIAGSTVSDSTKQRAQDILSRIDRMKDYIVDWEVSGPYFQEGKDYRALFDMPFAPEIDGGKDAVWRPMPAGGDSAQPYYMDLLKTLDGGEQRVAYLRTKMDSPKEQKVKLWIGSDDGNKVWVNGEVVSANNAAHAFTVDQYSAEAVLKKGANTILMKITQNNMPWGASLRIE
jgi:HEAT repeat protein